jgi:hypothetical protein
VSAVAPAATARVAPSVPSPGGAPPHRDATSLLPAPTTSFEAGGGDAMSAMYLLMSKRRNENTAASTTQIASNKNERGHKLEQEKAAIQREKEACGDGSLGFFDTIGHVASTVFDDATDLRVMDIYTDTKDNLDAAWNSPNFWSDVESGATVVAEVAAIVGATAVSIVTFGAGTPLLAVVVIGVAMSAASMADSQFHVLEKLGVNADIAAYVDLGLAVAGAVLTFGAGLSASGGAAVSAGSQLISRLGTTAVMAGAYAKITQGGAHIQNGEFKAEAKDAEADGKAARFEIKRTQRIEQMLIQGLADNAKSSQRALETLQGAMTTKAQTVAIATMRV